MHIQLQECSHGQQTGRKPPVWESDCDAGSQQSSLSSVCDSIVGLRDPERLHGAHSHIHTGHTARARQTRAARHYWFTDGTVAAFSRGSSVQTTASLAVSSIDTPVKQNYHDGKQCMHAVALRAAPAMRTAVNKCVSPPQTKMSHSSSAFACDTAVPYIIPSVRSTMGPMPSTHQLIHHHTRAVKVK